VFVCWFSFVLCVCLFLFFTLLARLFLSSYVKICNFPDSPTYMVVLLQNICKAAGTLVKHGPDPSPSHPSPDYGSPLRFASCQFETRVSKGNLSMWEWDLLELPILFGRPHQGEKAPSNSPPPHYSALGYSCKNRIILLGHIVLCDNYLWHL